MVVAGASFLKVVRGTSFLTVVAGTFFLKVVGGTSFLTVVSGGRTSLFAVVATGISLLKVVFFSSSGDGGASVRAVAVAGGEGGRVVVVVVVGSCGAAGDGGLVDSGSRSGAILEVAAWAGGVGFFVFLWGPAVGTATVKIRFVSN